ncbi:hypothetical protein QYE76_009496 [Lolium multiflorum]|uniref:Ribonuclease H1 N-terminal domain-containing protein n=1 Tax=Lolium multiflorum TaxID=4521 RepID=A0AAD8TVG4_LOLMU|nr:hypothetical protein QYE76_009496 [Lolium multiflorum]
MPPWFIPAYFEKTQASKLGDAQGIPFFIDNIIRFHVGAGIPSVAPHYISPPSTFNVLLGSYWFDKPWFHTEGKLASIRITPSSWGSQRTCVNCTHHSWRVCQHQVNGYSNNSYRGYATLEEAQQEYLTFLEEELLEDQAIDDAVPLAQLPPEEVHALQGAPPEVRPRRVKDYIIAFLIVVIVRIVFF